MQTLRWRRDEEKMGRSQHKTQWGPSWIIRLLLGSVLTAAPLVSIIASAVADEEIDTERLKLANFYRDMQLDSLSLFSSPPVEHIVPRRDRITFALATEYHDVTVVPQGVQAASPGGHILEFSGITISPYVAFSNKHFGIGFAADYGQMEFHYLRRDGTLAETTPGSYANKPYLDQYGELKFAGLGIFGYYIATHRWIPRFITPTLVVGGKSLRAEHKSTGNLTSQYQNRELTKFRYDVMKYEVGLDLGVSIVKRVTIMPWANIEWVNTEVPITDDEKIAVFSYSNTTEKSIINPAVLADQHLFWESAPALTYGIDFSVHFMRLDVHLGGLLGLVGNITKGSDRIKSNSISLGVSYDFKGS